MGPALLLLLGSLRGCSGRPSGPGLSVEPSEPLVPLGGSVQLNCSLGCAVGTVQWRGLDTNLGSVVSYGSHSVLRITDAAVAAEGTRICQGTCGERHFQRVVELRVYSLPQALLLSAEPAVLAPGRPATLHCAARHVYPPTGLELTWYRGQRLLRRADVEVEETEEGLFEVQDTLQLPAHEMAAGDDIQCQLTLAVRQETFTRAAAVAVRDAVTEQPVATSPGPPSTAPVTTGSPSTAASGAATQSIAATTAQAAPPREAAPQATRSAQAAATGPPSAQSADALQRSTGSRSPGALGAGPAVAVGTTVSLLGLIASAVTSRYLWRRLKSQYDLS